MKIEAKCVTEDKSKNEKTSIHVQNVGNILHLEMKNEMSKAQIKRKYLKEEVSLDEACLLLMEQFDMFRGEALEYLMR
jgi:uncharacterized protein YuzE